MIISPLLYWVSVALATFPLNSLFVSLPGVLIVLTTHWPYLEHHGSVMSLLKAPGTKTPMRVLLFCDILRVMKLTGALLLCDNLWTNLGALQFRDKLHTLQGALLLGRALLIGMSGHYLNYHDWQLFVKWNHSNNLQGNMNQNIFSSKKKCLKILCQKLMCLFISWC